jgi:hypothetical protein
MPKDTLRMEGIMNFKNLGRVFILVSILCFVFMCQSQSTEPSQMKWSVDDVEEWVIPDSIKYAYPEGKEEKDWKDLQRDLLWVINKMDADIEHYSYKRKSLQLALALAEHGVWFSKVDGSVISGLGAIKKFFDGQFNEEKIFEIQSIKKIEWFHMPNRDDDISATVTFSYMTGSIKSGGDLQAIDPEGGGEYRHRKVCTWY